MLRIKLRCTHRLAALWQAHAIGEEQRLGFDSPDFVTVEANVEDSFALRSYLLSLGARVAVDEPDELRGWLRDQGSQVSGGKVAEP